MSDSQTQSRWASSLVARAHEYWTPERTAQLLGDKRPVILPREGAVLLRALGLTRDDSSLPAAEVRKYFQINHMVALLGPALRELRARHAVIRVLDVGCGRSYLTLLLAWCARHVWQHSLEVIGLDRNPDVIAESQRRTELADLGDVVSFEVGDVASCTQRDINALVALHACDTATCDAIALGLDLAVDVLAVAPCCQAELARGWAELAERGVTGPFAAIWNAPHVRRETAADITDAMRVEIMRAAGYDVLAMEFVPAEHTRKNTLIRGIRHGASDAAPRATYEALRDATGGVDIRLARRLLPR